MERHLDEVLASQKRMLERGGKPTDTVDDKELRELFGKHLAQSEQWMDRQSHVDVLYVSYNEALENPAQEAARVNRFLGGKLGEQAMAGVIDPTLYRQRR
jgi:hypothetical protein